MLTCIQLHNDFSNLINFDSIINMITIPPKFWCRKGVNKYNRILYDDNDEELHVFKYLGQLKSTHYMGLLIFILVLFNGINTYINQSFFGIFTLERIQIPLSINSSLISSTITEIVFTIKEFRELCLTLSCVLVRITRHPFVIVNQFTGSKKNR